METYPLKQITDAVYGSGSEYSSGHPLCLVQHGVYLYVGFENGIIKTFNVATQEEGKTLIPK